MIIKVEDVSKRIRGVAVIDHVSLTFSSGKVYGLKGINGSGKTMLMRLICGLIYPTDGKILIDGKILGRDLAFPEELGLLIERPAFLDNYSGIDNLRLLSSIRDKIDIDDIRLAMERTGLDPDSKKKYKKIEIEY